MRRYFGSNGPCQKLETMGDLAGTVFLEPFEEVLKFSDQLIAVKVEGVLVGKSGGGISREEIVTAKEKVLNFLSATAENKKDPADLTDHLQKHDLIPFSGSPSFFMKPEKLTIEPLIVIPL